MDENNTANNFITGLSNDYRTYNPANSKYSSVASTRSGNFDPQRSFSSLTGAGRYTYNYHWYSNSYYAGDTTKRLTFLAPSASRPTAYFWGQPLTNANPVKAVYASHQTEGLSFFRISDGSKVVMDQFINNSWGSIYYNHSTIDSNLLTLSSAGIVSKIEASTTYRDNTDTPSTPLLFQTHGGMGANGGAMVNDYSRDAHWQADDRDTYIWYRPSFGSNVNIPENIEVMGEWPSNATGGRSGS